MTRTATGAGRHSLKKDPARALAHRPLLGICGSMIALLGVVLGFMSQFTSLDSGPFFLFAGFGLILSGALLAKRNIAGAWTYIVVFGATLAWSLQNADLGGSPLSYRIFGPIVMLLMLALLMPALRWSRARTVSTLAILIVATIVVGNFSAASDGSDGAGILSSAQSHPLQMEFLNE